MSGPVDDDAAVDGRTTPVLSVVIPAHNEARVIARTLAPLRRAADAAIVEIVIAVNGSDDGTSDVARRSLPTARVVEIATPSKVAALNAADAVATVFPRVYLDADVTISVEALLALGELLADHGKPLVAAPRLSVDLTGCSGPARAFARVWELTDYRQEGHVGSGVYGLSAAGRGRFAQFPDLIADDTFVQRLFAQDERVVLADHEFTVRSPRTLRAQIHRTARTLAGNVQLGEFHPRDEPATGAGGGMTGSVRSLIGRVARRPRRWVDFPVYVFGYAASRLLARRKARSGRLAVWERDESSRV